MNVNTTVGLVIFCAGAETLAAQELGIHSFQKIAESTGGFTETLDDADIFGSSIERLGDLDGDGIDDLAVGTPNDDDGGLDRGAVYVLFLEANGTVKSHQKISATEGGFTGTLDNSDNFGQSVAWLGDLDGPGGDPPAIAVGAIGDDDGGPVNTGAVWILFLNPDGTVFRHQKISELEGNLGYDFGNDDFGSAVEPIGDFNGDGVTDLAVGAFYDDGGGTRRGAAWLLFLGSDGKVVGSHRIGDGEVGSLVDQDRFGKALAFLGDVDGDGVGDLAVAAPGDDGGGTDRGAVYVLFLEATGAVKSWQEISDTQGGFTGTLLDNAAFGAGLSSFADLDGDGRPELAVGMHGVIGAVWFLSLNSDGTVADHWRVDTESCALEGTLDRGAAFGASLAYLGDHDGDGFGDLAVGAYADGPTNKGASLNLFLRWGDCGFNYCDTHPSNSANIAIDACDCAAASMLVTMSGAPPNQFTYLLIGANCGTTTNPPGAVGDLCLAGGQIGRYAQDAGATDGSGSYSTDLLNAVSGGGGGNLPTPPGGNLCAPPGQTWNFQYWHRDGMNPSKFSKAIRVTFH